MHSAVPLSARGSLEAVNLAMTSGATRVPAMLRIARRWLTAAALGVAALAACPTPSLGRSSTKVEWSSVRVPDGKDADRTARLLKGMLTKAARKADFGKAKSVKLTARVVEFTSTRQGDVQQVTCSIVGRVAGGPSAKSRISFGGSPDARAELEKQVLEMVANGLVARLAQIARTMAEREAAKEADEE